MSRSFPLAEFALALLFAEPLSQTEEDFLTGTHTRQAGNLKDGERDNGVGAGTASEEKKRDRMTGFRLSLLCLSILKKMAISLMLHLYRHPHAHTHTVAHQSPFRFTFRPAR